MYVVNIEREGMDTLQFFIRDPDHHIASEDSEPEFYSSFAYQPSEPKKKPKKVYKPVAQRTRPIAGVSPEEFRIVRNHLTDPLDTLPVLPDVPPPFVPGIRYTADRRDALDMNPTGFLLPEEVRLAHEIVRINEMSLAWDESEKGRLRNEYFPPVRIPTVEHVPWSLRNIPIPKGNYQKVIDIINEKIASGAYEASNSSYRSRWFTVVKKDGESLRIVHDLQPLNAVVIQDSSVPPITEDLAEGYGARACYAGLDLFVAFDQRPLDSRSRDLTTFQSPLGALRLTCIPMGYTNSVQIMQGDVTFILQAEIPHITQPFIDDVAVKGPTTRYENSDGTFELHAGNPGIRRFVWEHLNNVHRIIHRMGHHGGTFSGKKLEMCVPEVIIVGHRCTYKGREVVQEKLQVITDWPACTSVSEVRAFLGTLGLFRIFIRDFAKIARPIVQLTHQDVRFTWDHTHTAAMNQLKAAAVAAPALRPIDFNSDQPVVLGVDSSKYAAGYFLAQADDNGRRWYSRFGSITWNERESHYSQAKIELYGLFRALRNMRVHIIGARNLNVEVDAKYIKGMLANPDVQPNATINRWIAGILLFTFVLIHVPATQHTIADGLSRRPPADTDPVDTSDPEDWIDTAYQFGLFCRRTAPPALPAFSCMAYNLRSKGPADTDTPPESDSSDDEADNDEYQYDPDYLTPNAEDDPPLPELPIRVSTTELPVTDKSREADDRLALVKQFHTSTVRPEGMTDQHFTRFVRYASRFFLRNDRLWRRDPSGEHKVVVLRSRRAPLIVQAHDDLGHKGVFTVRLRLLKRFWWPSLDADVRWFIRSCHECQVRNPRRFLIAPTIATPAPLFRKAYLDTFLMPVSNGFRYVVQGRCSLTGYPEFRMLKHETAQALGEFIFEQILCRWGALQEIVTDNGPAFLSAAGYLSKRYGIHHIRISPYNSQANGIVESSHGATREALVKTSEATGWKWPRLIHAIFWSERVTISKNTGFSPYYAAHGVEPLLPFDLTEATYLAPVLDTQISTADLIAIRAQQLLKRDEDLAAIKSKVLAARYRSVEHFVEAHKHSIRDFDFQPGALVLVRNTEIEKSLDRKSKPRYTGPMIVVRRTVRGTYQLAEIDGAVSQLRYAAFRVIPYHSRTDISIPLDSLVYHPEPAGDMMLQDDAEATQETYDDDEEEPEGSESDSGSA